MAAPVSVQNSQTQVSAVRGLVGMSFWLTVLFGTILIQSLDVVESRTAQFIFAVLGLVHAGYGFWKVGGNRISAQGIVLFGLGLFAYYPALHLSLSPAARHGQTDLSLATFLILCAQVVIYSLVWRNRGQPQGEQQWSPPVKRSPWITPIGILMVAAGVGIEVLTGWVIGDACAYVGIVLMAVGVAWAPRRVLFGYVLVAIAFVVYLEFVFTGFGRLRIGALGLAVASVIALRWRGRLVKLFLLAAIVPALSYMAADRVDLSSELAGRDTGQTGLESVISPMVRFGQLLDLSQGGDLSLAFGATFFAATVALVPRTLWPGKPDGFGTDLAHVFNPQLVSAGHSELALIHGELFYNFGFIGLLLLVLFLGYFVNALDRLTLRFTEPLATGTLRDGLAVTLVVVLASSLVDLIWGGTFNFVARTGLRVLVLALLILLATAFSAMDPAVRGAGARIQTRSRHPVSAPLHGYRARSGGVGVEPPNRVDHWSRSTPASTP